jgi:aspartokinase
MLPHFLVSNRSGGKGLKRRGKHLDVIAAYWEPQIKTYGFREDAGLLLVEMKAGRSMLDSLGQELVRLGDLEIPFHLVFSQVSEGGFISVYLLIRPEWQENLMERVGSNSSVRIEVISPADMISFQGPHFGERFGILDAAFQALSSEQIRVIASVCSMSCVYLVLEAGQSEKAASALSNAFEVPRAFPVPKERQPASKDGGQ